MHFALNMTVPVRDKNQSLSCLFLTPPFNRISILQRRQPKGAFELAREVAFIADPDPVHYLLNAQKGAEQQLLGLLHADEF